MRLETFLFLAFATSICSFSGIANATQPTPSFKETTSQQVSELTKDSAKSSKLSIYDANGDSTRQKYGTLPRAIKLASVSSYPLTVLPADKHAALLFYCANQRCTASHTAAERAIEAGYDDVSVMTDGIQGWVGNGLPTEGNS